MDNRQAAEIIAASFHRTYEELAPEHGCKTREASAVPWREASAVPWREVPENNRALMVATVERLLDSGVIRPAGARPDDDAITGGLPSQRGWGKPYRR